MRTNTRARAARGDASSAFISRDSEPHRAVKDAGTPSSISSPELPPHLYELAACGRLLPRTAPTGSLYAELVSHNPQSANDAGPSERADRPKQRRRAADGRRDSLMEK
ncbi:hypothetical protein Q8A67_019053 [Cirrhinus molitorella]|uniref:Uncharacterized protein n=1 Tax=Cirrhinus molitorella TaxID=172907 RepID=A0AA88THK0_9TELE|nr:hypothetical protein Q8A67_019053 [Cirrhinus molitorella]